jgi:hypothetical protein
VIKLAKRQNLAVERRHQKGIFPQFSAFGDFGKDEPQLAVTITLRQRQLAFGASP